MPDPFNPYAPPTSEVDSAHQVGMVTREGILVRMDRNGQLPDRCVRCNAPALSSRVTRTLFWSPWQWRVALWAVPVLLLALLSTGSAFAAGLFFPAIFVMFIANLVVRSRFAIEIGLCVRHASVRRTLASLSLASIAAMVALPFGIGAIGMDRAGPVFLVILVAMIALGFAYSYTGANRIAIKRLSKRHVWLKGTGDAFREALPAAVPD